VNEESAILSGQSERRLNKLKILSNFFDNVDIMGIYIKTGAIHDLFREQNDLDLNKLELFHIQYTDSLIDLLDKLKRNNEQNLLIFYTEIETNEAFIEKIEAAKRTGSFETERKYYSSHFSLFLKKLYDDLIHNKTGSLIGEVLYFQEKYGAEFYRTLRSSALLANNTQLKYYEYGSLKIERKLLGKLNIGGFRIRFLCGFIFESQFFELFKITTTDDYFVFNTPEQQLYLVKNNDLSGLNITPNQSNQLQIVEQLKIKNGLLKEKVKAAKKYIPSEVAEVIKSYKNSLENINILSNIFKIDEETNILRAMLNFTLNNNNNVN